MIILTLKFITNYNKWNLIPAREEDYSNTTEEIHVRLLVLGHNVNLFKINWDK
jgi:hypothetical protein